MVNIIIEVLSYRSRIRCGLVSFLSIVLLSVLFASTAGCGEKVFAQRTATLKGHSSAVRTATFSADGKLILTGSSDCKAILWRVDGERIEKKTTLKGSNNYIDYVTAVAFVPNSRLAVIALGGYAKIWRITDADKAELLNGATPGAGMINDLAVSNDGKWIILGVRDNAQLWSLGEKGELGKKVVLDGHTKPVLAVAFSPDGAYAVTGSGDKSARLWKLDGKGNAKLALVLRGKRLWPPPEDYADIPADAPFPAPKSEMTNTHDVQDAAFSLDGKWLATGSNDRTAKLWKLDGRGGAKDVLTMKGHKKGVSCIAFSPDNKWLITGSWDNTAKIWKLDGEGNAEEMATIKPDNTKHGVNAAAFSPDGSCVIITTDETAEIWRINPPK